MKCAECNNEFVPSKGRRPKPILIGSRTYDKGNICSDCWNKIVAYSRQRVCPLCLRKFTPDSNNKQHCPRCVEDLPESQQRTRFQHSYTVDMPEFVESDNIGYGDVIDDDNELAGASDEVPESSGAFVAINSGSNWQKAKVNHQQHLITDRKASDFKKVGNDFEPWTPAPINAEVGDAEIGEGRPYLFKRKVEHIYVTGKISIKGVGSSPIGYINIRSSAVQEFFKLLDSITNVYSERNDPEGVSLWYNPSRPITLTITKGRVRNTEQGRVKVAHVRPSQPIAPFGPWPDFGPLPVKVNAVSDRRLNELGYIEYYYPLPVRSDSWYQGASLKSRKLQHNPWLQHPTQTKFNYLDQGGQRSYGHLPSLSYTLFKGINVNGYHAIGFNQFRGDGVRSRWWYQMAKPTHVINGDKLPGQVTSAIRDKGKVNSPSTIYPECITDRESIDRVDPESVPLMWADYLHYYYPFHLERVGKSPHWNKFRVKGQDPQIHLCGYYPGHGA